MLKIHNEYLFIVTMKNSSQPEQPDMQIPVYLPDFSITEHTQEIEKLVADSLDEEDWKFSEAEVMLRQPFIREVPSEQDEFARVMARFEEEVKKLALFLEEAGVE